MTAAGAFVYSEALKALAFDVLQVEEKLKGLISTVSKRAGCNILAKDFERSVKRFEHQINLASDDDLKVTVTIAFLRELDEFELKFLKVIGR